MLPAPACGKLTAAAHAGGWPSPGLRRAAAGRPRGCHAALDSGFRPCIAPCRRHVPSPPTLRPATPSDADALAAFGARSFTDTYRDVDRPDDIAAYVAEAFQPARVAGWIADPLGHVLLSEVSGQLAGYAVLKRGPAPGCVAGPAPIELVRLYLDQAHIGQGLGAALMHAALAEARRQQARTMWLGVYERNQRAIAFYERFGFRRVGTKAFVFGGEVHQDPVYAAPVPSGG